jgi:enoyl-CoA hydratase/carnithine racemase
MARTDLRISGAVAVLTLTRPEARNAVDMQMMSEVRAAVASIENDPEVRVAILTGAGSVFCAGMDLAGFVAGDRPGITDPDRFAGFAGAARAKPFIAAVNGPALAGGFELVLACDMAICVPSARFGVPEVRLGLIAAGGGAVRLPTILPPAIAAELLLTGDPMTAERALHFGLVNRIVAEDALMDSAMSLAERIATAAPDAVSDTRAVMSAARSGSETAAWAVNDSVWSRVEASGNAREGTRAFLDKRQPRFGPA